MSKFSASESKIEITYVDENDKNSIVVLPFGEYYEETMDYKTNVRYIIDEIKRDGGFWLNETDVIPFHKVLKFRAINLVNKKKIIEIDKDKIVKQVQTQQQAKQTEMPLNKHKIEQKLPNNNPKQQKYNNKHNRHNNHNRFKPNRSNQVSQNKPINKSENNLPEKESNLSDIENNLPKI